MKKAQIVSFDFSMSVLIFIVFLSIFIGLILASRSLEASRDYDFEFEYLFDNLENNLVHDPETDNAFLKDSRIDPNRLALFNVYLANTQGVDLDTYIFGNISTTHGIGLDPAAYDACLYAWDDTGFVYIGSLRAIGDVKGGTCDSIFQTGGNPCRGYDSAMSVFMPVLYDTGNPNQNKIVQLHITACKI